MEKRREDELEAKLQAMKRDEEVRAKQKEVEQRQPDPRHDLAANPVPLDPPGPDVHALLMELLDHVNPDGGPVVITGADLDLVRKIRKALGT
jgi:hypothetical protein